MNTCCGFLLKESSEIDLLRKQLKEKEEINSKLKQLAIKTKKELGDKQTKVREFLSSICIVL